MPADAGVYHARQRRIKEGSTKVAQRVSCADSSHVCSRHAEKDSDMSLAEQRRLWAWHLSALVYEWSYIQVAHQIDEDFLDYLGERMVGAVVADCGCGPGVVTEKLLQAGAARVVAIDANASMIERASIRLAKGVATGKVLVCHASHEAGTLTGVRQRALRGR